MAATSRKTSTPINERKGPYLFYDAQASDRPVNEPPAQPWDPSKKATPSQIVREIPLTAATHQLNAQWQGALKGTVWANYQLISTQWPTDPADNCEIPSPTNPLGTPAPNFLANATLETYNQGTTPQASSCCQALVQQLNSVLTLQFRLGFLIEQVEKDPDNALCRVERTTELTDGLGLPRPQITYELSDYTQESFKQARLAATHIITELMGATELTDLNTRLEPGSQTVFEYDGQNYPFFGAGHLMGTYRMGSDRNKSVVDKDQRSWDHPDLFLVGKRCHTNPTVLR
ncbi:hypothetical protein BGP84_10030 [Pseudomonas putida]|uniref:Glucose-methanol-choline oxidoreductase C-terminal domain-containing protein n=1 Tax=Pseudomonas putida TaxID=303 RepID=A0A2S3X3D0_PSEPU|nr:hypothetical protein BGP84_10030 [Pseudomonas putida]POG16192.1 hypothetical protein BGP85_08525 [Pseudomonas putida]